MTHRTPTMLQKAIDTVNNRYLSGLNDDDQVKRMIEIDRRTKGYTFMPEWDTYRLCTDFERLKYLVEEHGQNSNQVKSFHDILKIKGGEDYVKELNGKLN